MSTITVVDSINRVQQRLSPIELIYTSHPRWPLPPPSSSARSVASHEDVYRVSVLDSSFNPPTLAHLALAKAPAIGPLIAGNPSQTGQTAYDAKLLLLSVRNADKQLAPGDATYVQRLEMMTLLAKDLEQHDRAQEQDDNVAVAIIDEPTFVGKSKVLLHALRSRLYAELAPAASVEEQPVSQSHIPRIQLTFLVGIDTLERLFAPRYYGSDEQMLSSLRGFLSAEGDDAWVVCARRITSDRSTEEERECENRLLATIHEFVDSGRVTLIDIGEDERIISSTDIRRSRRQGDAKWKTWVTTSVSNYIEQENLYFAA